MTPFKSILILIIAVLTFGCQSSEPSPIEVPSLHAEARAAETPGEKKDAHDGLHNLMKVSDRIYSGSEPDSEPGFISLQKLGVKTIVSVDGAKPQLELARKQGIRYVHIPFGYDKVPESASAAITRVVRETEGPIYIHCHHGKHRGPAAAAIACIASNSATVNDALRILEQAGTSKDYAGLWRDVTNFVPPPVGADLPKLVESAEVESLAAAMARIDRTYDNLKSLREARWTIQPDHPDRQPVHEALMIMEGFTEALRLLDKKYDDAFRQQLAESETTSNALLTALRQGNPEQANKSFSTLEQSCKECHKKYRD